VVSEKCDVLPFSTFEPLQARKLLGWRGKRIFGSMTEMQEFFKEAGSKCGKLGGRAARPGRRV